MVEGYDVARAATPARLCQIVPKDRSKFEAEPIALRNLERVKGIEPSS